MGKEKKQKSKKKTKGGLIKQLSLTLGIAAVVIVLAVVIISAVNKSTIKYITVEGAYKELYVGNPEFGSAEVGVNVYPSTASTENLVAYSSDANIASVTFDGAKLVINAVSTGSATVYVQHGSKSSLKDSIQIEVKDVDIEDLNFVSTNENGEEIVIPTIDIKKDGFEHKIKFNMDPIDANMNNLKVVYDATVLNNAYIDQVQKCLVVVPKTDIVQTSTIVDVEIYQNTTEGIKAAQYARLQLNLKAREAYIRFNLSSDPSKGYSLNHTNIVYLEQQNATDVYVKPDIGYDANFTSIGNFNSAEYNVYIDGSQIVWPASGEYRFNNKISINQSSGGYYYFKVLPDFMEGDNIYVTFEHKFTGVTNSLQFIYLATSDIGLSSEQTFNLETSTQLELNQEVALNFSYDNGVKYKVVEIYAFKYETINGQTVRVKTDSFGDGKTDETIIVKKTADKIFLRAVNVTERTIIQFGIECDYWDSRYVRFNIEDLYVTGEFKVTNEVSDIIILHNGIEVHAVEQSKNATTSVSVEGVPFGNNNLNVNNVTWIIRKGDVLLSADELTVALNSETGKFDITTNNLSNGVYNIEFTYNGIKTKLYVEVV